MPQLRTAQRLELADILRAAFLRPDVGPFLRIELNKAIGDYASPDDNDRTAMLGIVRGADEEGWSADLLARAIAQRPKNDALKTFDNGLKALDKLRSVLLARYGRPESFDLLLASINETWSDRTSPRPYRDQLLEVVSDAQCEGWLAKLIDKVAKESGEDIKRMLSDIDLPLAIAPVANLDVVLLGSAFDELAPRLSGLIDSCAALLQQGNIRTLALKDRWATEWPKQSELKPPRSTTHLIAIHCVDVTTATFYAVHDDLLAKNIKKAAGDEQDVSRHIVWLPDAAGADAVAERVRLQLDGYHSTKVHFQIGAADQLLPLVEQWLGIAGDRTTLTPAFAYQPIKSTKQAAAGDIVEDIIIPTISPELQDRFRPPEWETILFSQEDEALRLIADLTGYPFGIVAINNFNGNIDREGTIPKDFLDRITRLDDIIEDQIQAKKLDPGKILRLAIIATTHPHEHLFQYLRARNAIIARWRFIAVSLTDVTPQVVGGHLDLLCAELKSRLGGNGRGTVH